jgi:hypothetical protein
MWERKTILQHEFIPYSHTCNVADTISLNSGLNFVSLALVRCAIVCCNSVVAQVNAHVDFCLLDCLQLRSRHKYELQHEVSSIRTTRADWLQSAPYNRMRCWQMGLDDRRAFSELQDAL